MLGTYRVELRERYFDSFKLDDIPEHMDLGPLITKYLLNSSPQITELSQNKERVIRMGQVPKKPKIMLIGNAQHGKDTVAALLRDALGLQFRGSSEIANEAFIYDALKDELGYDNLEQCYNDRDNHRPLWHQLIKLFNFHDKAALSRLIFETEGQDMYVGCRNTEELQAAKKAGLFDYVVWVDASARKPDEKSTSFDISKCLADFTIDNNEEGESHLIEVVNAFAAQLKKVHGEW